MARRIKRRRKAVRRSASRSKRRNPARDNCFGYPYKNPGPYWQTGNWIAFENGRKYRVDRATQRQASGYMIRVKEAEDAGRRIPRGPNGLTPASAAVLLHFGRPKAKRRSRKASCKPCGMRKTRKTRKTASRKPASRKTMSRKTMPRKTITKRRSAVVSRKRRSAPVSRTQRVASVTRRASAPIDQWSWVGETFSIGK